MSLKMKLCQAEKSIYLSHLNLAISKLTDEIDHVIVEPKLDIQAQGSQYLPTVGEITWQEDD